MSRTQQTTLGDLADERPDYASGNTDEEECWRPWCDREIAKVQLPQHVRDCEPPDDWDGEYP